MERPYPVVEFEAVVTPEGTITLPPQIAKAFTDGRAVTVRITDGVVSKSLRLRGITEEIIEHVSELQLEQRENVLTFFGAEGSIAGKSSFRKGWEKKRRAR